MSAQVFDEFIVDDFLCTADTSSESKSAKGNRTWSQYRRDLLTSLSKEIFIEPAKQINPNISLIIKYPQWYDRFHLFGYDLAREPQLFDKVWVGTESRGQYTQRYGFVQPYEGFVNYRWIKSIAGNKIGGAWFDHGDCDENDFIEQAYQSVLAGAEELVLFNYNSFVYGHRGHHRLRAEYHHLADLARHVSQNPVVGVAGYKPINSDAGGDLYIMDFIGSLGIPLIPVHQYPQDSKVILLPTQAAADNEIAVKIERSVENGSTIIFTSGFLAHAVDGEKLAELAGIKFPLKINPHKAPKILVGAESIPVEYGLDLASAIQTTAGEALLSAVTGSGRIPFLIKSKKEDVKVYTINTHTFSQEDFDKVGEVLLCPKPLGLMELPESWTNIIRDAVLTNLDIKLEAPTRIVIQPMGTTGWMFHNYNNTKENISFINKNISNTDLVDGFSGQILQSEHNQLNLQLEPRSRIWVKMERDK